jgi:trimeric autotransporter adhesin
MQIKVRGLWGVMAIVALIGCGSSSGTGGTGGKTSNGGGTGSGTGGGTGTGGTGSGTGGTTGAFTTSVPSGTKATALTTAQAAQLCSDLQSYVDNNLFPTLCRAEAASSGPEAAYFDLLENPTATDSELRAACAAGGADAGSCLSLSADAGTGSCDISEVPSTCQATVGDYTKCINDSTAADLQFYASVPSCSTLTAASVMAYFAADGGASAGPAEPTSCSKFDSTCDVDGGSSVTSAMSLRMMPKRRR